MLLPVSIKGEKDMKRICLLLCLALIISLTACRSTATAEKQQPVSTQELDGLFEEMAASEQTTNDRLQQLVEEEKELLLRYLMTDFITGNLEGCMYRDGSAEYLKFHVWDSLLGGETMPLETETPQEYWLQWCDLAERAHGAEDTPVSSLYVELMERALPLSEEELDTLFEELAQSGQRTNETLQLLKAREPDRLFDYLVLEFLDGELNGCQLDDGSVGSLKFSAWDLGMEGIESPMFSPQQYWEEWSTHAQNLYERNGYDVLIEIGHPLTARCGKLMSEYKK